MGGLFLGLHALSHVPSVSVLPHTPSCNGWRYSLRLVFCVLSGWSTDVLSPAIDCSRILTQIVVLRSFERFAQVSSHYPPYDPLLIPTSFNFSPASPQQCPMSSCVRPIFFYSLMIPLLSPFHTNSTIIDHPPHYRHWIPRPL